MSDTCVDCDLPTYAAERCRDCAEEVLETPNWNVVRRKRAPAEPRMRTCERCANTFELIAGSKRRTCSTECALAQRHRRRVPLRSCEVCGSEFERSYAGQRTCGRVCGIALRRQTATGVCRTCGETFKHGGAGQPPWHCPSCQPREEPSGQPVCVVCKQGFDARSNAKYCSYACKVRMNADRINELYALAATAGAAGAAWRDILVGYLRERDGDRCGICRRVITFGIPSGPRGHKSGIGPSVDHLVPRNQGGGDELTNLRLAHWKCNRNRRKKGGNEQLLLVG